jgi:DNA helicase-2/ATP-dependent DNA helicase PcrA
MSPRPAARRAPEALPLAKLDGLLAGLNPEQRRAVTTKEGPLLVLAGAGSGKTRVITVRIAWLLAQGVKAKALLAVTFTNRAANEMRERVAALVGAERAAELTVGTFHAFCVRLLRANGEAIGVPRNFAICDSADQLAASKGVLRELRVAEASLAPGALQARISLHKNRLRTPSDALALARDPYEVLVARAWQKYDEQLRRTRSLDFDDLLLFALRLLRESDATRREVTARFRWLLVDEYQDTNAPQYEILRELAGEHGNLCVVGDDDQSIYGWRGADVTKILHFERDFAGAPDAPTGAVTVVRLETNYRSTIPILEAANRVIANNPNRHDKQLRSALGDGAPVSFKRLEDELTEAEFVTREIADLVAGGQAAFRDHAVLFRTATQPRAIEAQLRARSIPYVMVGGMSFFDRKEVRDVLAYLRLVANPDDEVSLLRVVNCPPRGIGRTTIEAALAYATREGIPVARAFERASAIVELKPAAVAAMAAFRAKLTALGAREPGRDLAGWLETLLRDVDYRAEVDRVHQDAATREERWQGVMELVNFAENHARRAAKPTLQSFLEAVTLSQEEELENDEEERKRDAVTLTTFHSAKGLEFPRVFLVGVEEGILPHARAVHEGSVEEERRLMYVGITRAQRHLTVTCVKSRARAGLRGECMPSRFLYEMRGEPPPRGWKGCDAPLSETTSRRGPASVRQAPRRP